MNFSIVIPNHNGQAFLKDCLESISTASKNWPQSKIEIIMVDNGSTDKSQDIFRKYSQKIIRLDKNLGFGEAVNRGVAIATYDHIIIMNNDLTIDKSWLKTIDIAIKTNPEYACYYGLVLNQDGTKIESEGFKFYKQGKAININNNKPFIKNSELKAENYPIWGAPASIIIYKKDIFQRLNGFDPNFFAYIEDVDLAYRLNQHNYQTLYIPRAVSYHLGGGTSSKINHLRTKMTIKNWWLFIFKNYSPTEIIKNILPILLERLRNLKSLLIK